MRISDWSSDVCSSDLGFSLLCADALVENDHLLRAPEADEPGQQPGHAAVRRKADRTISGREMGRLRSQHNITQDRKAKAHTRRRTIDDTEQRLVHTRQPSHRHMQCACKLAYGCSAIVAGSLQIGKENV